MIIIYTATLRSEYDIPAPLKKIKKKRWTLCYFRILTGVCLPVAHVIIANNPRKLFCLYCVHGKTLSHLSVGSVAFQSYFFNFVPLALMLQKLTH